MITLRGLYGKTWDVTQGHFPDGTLSIKLPWEEITAIEWNYENDAELFTLICVKRHYDNMTDKVQGDIDLIMPYVPHARMDRVKETSDVFTLKYFCEVINSLNFHRVVVLDAHSSVTAALLDRVENYSAEDNIRKAINRVFGKETGECGHEFREEFYEKFILFFPDEGAMKRYSGFSPVPYTFGVKNRDWKTGKILGLQIINPELVRGKTVLIVDDICSKGGTFLHSARALKEAGAWNVYLYVTHAENTMVTGDMYKDPNLIKEIITTESIFDSHLDTLNKVNVIQDYL